MTTDRELLQEMVEALIDTAPWLPAEHAMEVTQLAFRASNHLDHPAAVELSDEELLLIYSEAKRDYCHEGPVDDWSKRAERAAIIHGLRAVAARVQTIQPTTTTTETP